MPSQVDDIEFYTVVRYLEREFPSLAKETIADLFELVQPDFDSLSYDHRERLSELAVEWTVFDRPVADGKPGIELYCSVNPDRRGNGYMSRLREAAKNQFSSIFSVEDIDIDAHRLTIVDICTGDSFQVRDFALSESIYCEGAPRPFGVLLTRLTNVRGTWFFPGNPIGFYPIAVSERMVEMLSGGAGSHPAFIELVKWVFGSADRMESGPLMTKLSEIDVLDFEQMEEFLREVEVRYHACAGRCGISIPWDDVIEAIVHEDGDVSPAEALRETIGDVASAETGSMEALSELLDVWAAAWNALPHEALGGIAPVVLQFDTK